MTVKPRTLDERYQVYVDFKDGGTGVLVNAYSTPEQAARCVNTLESEVPSSYVARAWMVDTEG